MLTRLALAAPLALLAAALLTSGCAEPVPGRQDAGPATHGPDAGEAPADAGTALPDAAGPLAPDAAAAPDAGAAPDAARPGADASFAWDAAEVPRDAGLAARDAGAADAAVPSPGAPTNLSARARNAFVALSWDAYPAAGLVGYRLYRDGALRAEQGTATTFVDLGLANGVTYQYTLTALLGPGLESAGATVAATPTSAAGPAMEWLEVSPDGQGLVGAVSRAPFTPYGFNYDHDEDLRLLEDYWTTEWSKVESDLAEAKALGANTLRVHLQFGKFMSGPAAPRADALAQLARLVDLAERLGVYLDLTGLGTYRVADTPAWYDALSEPQRWAAQGQFWSAVAGTVFASPAVAFYDLRNEPFVPGSPLPPGQWTTGSFGGFAYLEAITLDAAGRAPSDVARAWIGSLRSAIRSRDARRPITVGLVPIAGWLGFTPSEVAKDLDLLSAHFYPSAGAVKDSLALLGQLQHGRPVIVEETFPLHCGDAELEWFMLDAASEAAGYLGFYWGKTVAELDPPATAGDGLMLSWLRLFQRVRPFVQRSVAPEAALHQYWNAAQGDHYYTVERNDSGLAAFGYAYESVVGSVLLWNTGGAVPLCRYYGSARTDHFYTVDCDNDAAAALGYAFDRVEGWVYAAPGAGRVPLYRYWNPTNGDHFYATARNDAALGALGYSFERLECYVLP